MPALHRFCIYTIAHPDKLQAAERAGKGRFPEKKAWKTGHRLWSDAKTDGIAMAVVFADSTDCSRLTHWGIIKKIAINAEGTLCLVKDVKKIKGRHSPQELILKSTGRRIAPNFIRPYAICQTPSFVEIMG
jgi:hypothetical protein